MMLWFKVNNSLGMQKSVSPELESMLVKAAM